MSPPNMTLGNPAFPKNTDAKILPSIYQRRGSSLYPIPNSLTISTTPLKRSSSVPCHMMQDKDIAANGGPKSPLTKSVLRLINQFHDQNDIIQSEVKYERKLNSVIIDSPLATLETLEVVHCHSKLNPKVVSDSCMKYHQQNYY